MTRFELATPATRTRCATKLRHIPTLIFNFQTLIEAQFGYSLLNGSIELSLSIRFLKIPSGSLSWTSFKKCLRTFFTSPFVRLGGFRFAFKLRNGSIEHKCSLFACPKKT